MEEEKRMEVVEVAPKTPSLAASVRQGVARLVSRKTAIDARFEQDCDALAAWSAHCYAELDEVDRRICEREDAIDVDVVCAEPASVRTKRYKAETAALRRRVDSLLRLR